MNDDSQELVEKQTDTTYNNTFFVKGQFSHVNNDKQLNYSFGFDANLEEIKGARIKNKEQRLNSYGLFASINYNFLENFSIQPGARFTFNSTYGSIVSPAVHFKYQINKNNKILISYANGFRSPSINQLYLNFKAGPFLVLGNEDLEAEKSDNYSISSYHEIKLFKRNLIIEPSLFYNDVENLISLTGRAELFEFKPANEPMLHPGQSANVLKNGEKIGYLGALHPNIEQKLGLSQRVFVFELDVNTLRNGSIPAYVAQSRFPSIRRDIALLVDQEITASGVIDCIKQAASERLTKVELFDVYVGEGIDSGRKSLALGLTLQDLSRTLKDTEIEEEKNQILAVLNSNLGATLRE